MQNAGVPGHLTRLLWESSQGPLEPEARIMPLDQAASNHFSRGFLIDCHGKAHARSRVSFALPCWLGPHPTDKPDSMADSGAAAHESARRARSEALRLRDLHGATVALLAWPLDKALPSSGGHCGGSRTASNICCSCAGADAATKRGFTAARRPSFSRLRPQGSGARASSAGRGRVAAGCL